MTAAIVAAGALALARAGDRQEAMRRLAEGMAAAVEAAEVLQAPMRLLEAGFDEFAAVLLEVAANPRPEPTAPPTRWVERGGSGETC